MTRTELGPRRLGGMQFLLPAFALTALIIVPLAVFVAPVVASRPVSLTVPVLLFGAMVVYCAVRMAQLMWEAEPRWMVLGFWVFTYAWIAVAGLTQTLADANPLGITLPLWLATAQSGVLLLGIVAFDVASRLRPGPSRGFAVVRWRSRVLDPRRTMVLAGVALVLTPAFVAGLGGVSALFSSREAVDDTLSNSGLYAPNTNATGGTLSVLAGVLPLIALLCLSLLLADDPAFRRRPLPWVFLLGLVAVNVLVNNPISNSRYWAFTVILACLFVWRFLRRPGVITVFVTLFALSSLLLFPYFDAFRYTPETAQQYNLQGNTYDHSVDYLLAKTDYGSVTDVAVALRVVEHSGHSWGFQLLGVPTFWVPRSVWPDKPDNTAFLIADEIGYPNRNLDSPLWAEGYVDFGWAGTALLLAAAGLLARRLDDAFVALRHGVATHAVPLAAVLVPVVAGYEFILLRGSLLQATARIVMLVLLLFLVSRVPSRPPTIRRSFSMPRVSHDHVVPADARGGDVVVGAGRSSP